MTSACRVQLLITALVLAPLPGNAMAQGSAELAQTTAHYRVILEIGPLTDMLTPDQAAGAKEGEVMLQTHSRPMPMMATSDQGLPVNHHLQVHLYNRATGAAVADVTPMVAIMDQATGASKRLGSLLAMQDVKTGARDRHFGNNLFLPDGEYTVTVVIGRDMAVFKDLPVTGEK